MPSTLTRSPFHRNNPVLAFAATVEATPTKSSPVVFALGYVRDPVVRYAVDGGVELRHSYFWTEFPKFEDAVSSHFVIYLGSRLTPVSI